MYTYPLARNFQIRGWYNTIRNLLLYDKTNHIRNVKILKFLLYGNEAINCHINGYYSTTCGVLCMLRLLKYHFLFKLEM